MDLSYLARTIDTIEAIYGSEIGNLAHPFPLELYDDLESLANQTQALSTAERAWRINRLARAVENEWCDECLAPLLSATIRDCRATAASADAAELIRFMDGLDPELVGPIPDGVVRALDAFEHTIQQS